MVGVLLLPGDVKHGSSLAQRMELLSLLSGFSLFLGTAVVVEQMIQRNGQRAVLNKWTLGQTLALTMPLLNFFTGAYKTWNERLKDVSTSSEKTRIAKRESFRPQLWLY
jgi:hypothetical protein